ncbi:MAG: hypothetical protein AAFO63_07805 [Pseudomonadota bacterium]
MFRSNLGGTLLAAVLVGDFVSSLALAQSPADLNGKQIAPPTGLLLAGMDGDGDAVLTHDEMQTGVSRMFLLGDTDRSGALTPIEFTKWSEVFLGQTYALPSFMNFDHDQNSQISETEFRETIQGVARRFDRNADELIERSELLETINLPAIDQEQMRRQMESEMRRNMEDAMRRRRATQK